MDNTNKQKIVEAIWADPGRVFGCDFRQSGAFFENKRGGEYDETGKIRIALTSTQTNIMVFYNGASRAEKCDVFTYLADYVLHTAGFWETLTRCAEIYGVQLELSHAERQKMSRQQLAREVAPSLVEALRLNPGGEVAAYVTKARGLNIDEHFGELSEKALQRVAEVLKMKERAYSNEDLRALGLTRERAAQGYNLVIPYYHNGQVVGFVFRNIAKDFKGPKYLYSEDLGRKGYCHNLTIGEPAVFVEGQLDAIRLTQAGVKNVIAMGGAKINEEIVKLLKGRNITQITYIPDLEYNEKGEKKTKIIKDAMAGFLGAQVDGEPVVKNLCVVELTAPQGANLNGLKIDADTFGKMNGNEALRVEVELNAVTSWHWELSDLIYQAKANAKANGAVNNSWFQSEFDKIYNRCGNFYERQRIKEHIKNEPIYAEFGITPQALEDIDEWTRNREYNNQVKAISEELKTAVEKGVNPVTVAKVSARLSDIQGTNTREAWERQLNQSYEDELKDIAAQPETLKTRWELGNISKQGTFIKYEDIEYWPADLSVYCAPTSHGKTMFLMQSALDAVQANDKTYIYVSCEENKRQLLERALNVYLNIDTTESGKDQNGDYCFIRGARKRAIKAALKGADTCSGYPEPFMGLSEHFAELKARILEGARRYGDAIRPRLIMIHTDASAESIAANISHYVKQYRAQGVEVGGVFVDYMQLLTSENKTFSRTDELKDVCKALKGCAARLELPLILAAQLNRTAIAEGIDTVTVANIGEGADIERIAHDLYMIWQVDKTKRDNYFTWVEVKKDNGATREKWKYERGGERSNRIFTKPDPLRPHEEDGHSTRELKAGYMYVEQLKARDGRSGGWGLFPFDGERGRIGAIDKNKMSE